MGVISLPLRKKRKLLTFRPERLDADRKFIGFVCLMTISLCQSIRAHLVMWHFVEPYLGNTMGSGRFQGPGSSVGIATD